VVPPYAIMSVLSNNPGAEAALLHANLERVFSQRDGVLRLEAIRVLYAEDAVLYEPDAVATGHTAICQAVETLLSHLPPAFAFTASGPAVGHHGMARLRWAGGPPDGPALVTGTDVAGIANGRIQTLHVFLDPAA
jgi:hypothetical protein